MNEEMGALPDLSTILSRVSENPQAMAMLSSILGANGIKTDAKEDHQASVKEEKEVLPASASAQGKRSRKNDDRRCLLSALKPFLSPERRQAVNTLLLVLEGISLLSAGKEPPCT